MWPVWALTSVSEMRVEKEDGCAKNRSGKMRRLATAWLVLTATGLRVAGSWLGRSTTSFSPSLYMRQ